MWDAWHFLLIMVDILENHATKTIFYLIFCMIIQVYNYVIQLLL